MANVPGADPVRPVGGEPAAEDLDLVASLNELSQLSADRFDLGDLLIQVATMAVTAIPGADWAGLTVQETGRSAMVVRSADLVDEIDAVEAAIGEGPGISAAEQGRVMRSGSLGGDARWPRYGPRVSRLGVHSVLSLPLVTPEAVVGTMSLYARTKDAFDERAETIGELFALPAAISVHNAQILARARRLARNLQKALDSRPLIDQAIGILRSRSGCTSAEAFDRLRQLSQAHQAKVAEVAREVVVDAVRRARQRSSSPEHDGPTVPGHEARSTGL